MADAIAVKGDPLKDVTVLQHVQFVMKDGVVYKDEVQPAAVNRPVMAEVDRVAPVAQGSY